MKVSVVCLGNICRSPMAAAVLRHAVAEAGLDDVVEVDSAGTAGYHVGDPADPRARAALRRRGYDDTHTARRFAATDFAGTDRVYAMDAANLADLQRLAPAPDDAERVVLLRGTGEVPDPYYDDSFDRALDLIEAAVPAIIADLRAQLGR
jgi:protein-tyrosine phosphatase